MSLPAQAAPDQVGRTLERVAAIGALVVLAIGSITVGTHDGKQASGRVPAPVTVPDDLPVPPAIPSDIRDAAFDKAGCEVVVDGQPLEDRTHLEAGTAPPPDALYPDRPPHSGRHYASVLRVPDRVPDEAIDERAVLHNMEHGSVVVWFDLEVVPTDDVADMQAWMRERRSLGFESDAAGGIWVSPADVISSGSPVALRAWGVAVDCARFDRTVADAFLADHWGSNGDSPEAGLSPFPTGVFGEVGNAV